MDTETPHHPELVIVKSRLSSAAWVARVAEARNAAPPFVKIASLVERGDSLNAAIAATLPASRRSWAMRHWRRFLERDWEGLIDLRLPREPQQAKLIREVLEKACARSGEVKLPEAVGLLEEERPGVPLPSPATIKRELRRARERTNKQAKERTETVPLAFAGGELILAAEAETGAIAALRDEVVALGKEAVAAAGDRAPEKDVMLRGRKGHFTVAYNRKRRRKRGEKTASYMRPAEEKAKGRVLIWRFMREQPETLQAKLTTLVLEPMVSRIKGWEGLRAPQAAGLEPLTGFAYMPSTLAKFTSALAQSSAGERLLGAAGRVWHTVAQQRWGEAGSMAALYIDNQVKEVWSSLFTQSAKVSKLSRVMPAITTTYVHTGAGSPLVMAVQSGSAPLLPQLSRLVERAEKVLGDGIRRVVVVDAEVSTFDTLAAFSQAKRVIVTPLRPSRAPELELRYGQGSYFRPYREHDELRVGTATLHHRSTGRTLEVGALVVRREGRESETVLLTPRLGLELGGSALADLYFARWPLQENWFKEGAAAVQLGEHRGNCSRMVANVAVVTEAERLQSRLAQGWPRLVELERAEREEQEALERAEAIERRAERLLSTRRRRLDAEHARGEPERRAYGRAASEHHEALQRAEGAQRELERARRGAEKVSKQRREMAASLSKAEARARKLEGQREIRQIDVALDSVLTATKLTGAQLITFVLREYLLERPMTPQTFVARMLPMQGRKEVSESTERIVFYENPRDPEMTEALRGACKRLSARKLQRENRRLLYEMAPPPTAA